MFVVLQALGRFVADLFEAAGGGGTRLRLQLKYLTERRHLDMCVARSFHSK
jgi:hypothetical protein